MQAQYRSNRLSERLTDTPREPRGTNGLCLDPPTLRQRGGTCVCVRATVLDGRTVGEGDECNA